MNLQASTRLTLAALAGVVSLCGACGRSTPPAPIAGQQPTAVTSKAEPTPTPAPAVTAQAKAGKPAGRPAPALSADTLAQVRTLEAEAKGFYNAGVTARTAGDNSGAREQQAKAKAVLDQAEKLIEKQLEWQEEAEMENWAQPAEYVELAKLFNSVMGLAKKVRMGGGK